MSTTPWGTMNDWLQLEVAERATKAQRRLDAHTRASRTQAAPIVRTAQATPIAQSTAITQASGAPHPTITRTDCTEAA